MVGSGFNLMAVYACIRIGWSSNFQEAPMTPLNLNPNEKNVHNEMIIIICEIKTDKNIPIPRMVKIFDLHQYIIHTEIKLKYSYCTFI